MLNSDQLGKKGEARFKEICEDAQMVCSKSERDITGWDFIVEFPFDNEHRNGVSLDARAVPLSCHIQIKTLLEKNDTVQMRLTSAERLAKELKPSFVYVFKVNETLEFTGAYLIHMLGEPLEKILKRLRKEEARGTHKPNQKTISFSARRDGTSLKPTGGGLREALTSLVGPDLPVYAAQKSERIAKAGFGQRPFEVTATLHLNGHDELVDAFLGLKADIPVSNLKTAVTRFEIKLPENHEIETASTISITPSPADTCTIVVSPRPLSQPAIFKGKVFFPAIPNLPTEHLKVLIDSDLFSLTLSNNGCHVQSKPNLPPQPPSVWLAYWKFALAMTTGTGTIKLAADSGPFGVTLNIPKRTVELDPIRCQATIDVCEKASALLRLAGVAEEPLLSSEEIYEQEKDILRVYALTRPELGLHPFSCVTERTKELVGLSTLDLTYVDFLQIGDTALGYYGISEVTLQPTDSGIEWKSDNMILMALVELPHFPNEFDEFTQMAVKSTRCNNIYARAPDTTTLGPSA